MKSIYLVAVIKIRFHRFIIENKFWINIQIFPVRLDGLEKNFWNCKANVL